MRQRKQIEMRFSSFVFSHWFSKRLSTFPLTHFLFTSYCVHVNNSHYRTKGMWETAALSSSSSPRVLACLACPLQSSHVCSRVKCFLSSSEAPHYRERLLVPSVFSCATGCNYVSTNASIRWLSQQSVFTLVLLQFENVRRQTDAAMVST
jgi:hypothetical protein